jgi:2-polyprenyl-6-methoxyphenol hydroxylase-like FAD-dependent oxidoreductase
MNKQVDVLIVGAGPVGLALAAELRHKGVDALIIDRNRDAAQTSRACVIHARTLEVLEPLGVTAQLLAAGVKVPIFRIRDRDRALVTIDFSEIESDYPFTLMYPQDRTERVLLATLERLRGEVHRPSELIDFQTRQERIVANVSTGGAVVPIEARWLVGCDGMHSTVREQAGIPFEGAPYEQGFVLADLSMRWPLSREEVSLFYSPQGLVVVAPLPDDRFRIVATDGAAPEHPSKDYVQALLDARGPSVDRALVHDVAWSSRFRIHHRVARTARSGRILLCGDAAHVHSPAGGQGMNTGIQDAMSLAPLLAAVLRGGDEALLDRWAVERHRIAADVVTMTDRMTRMATLTSPLAQSLRNAAVALLGHVPPVRAAAARRLAELDAR